MAYSIDPNENRGNAYTPSEHINLNEQLLYRFASLEASLKEGFRRIDDNIARFQKDLTDSQIEQNDKISKLAAETKAQFDFKRARIDATEKRITALETWSAVLMGKVAMAVSVVVLVWTFIAPSVRNFLGIDNG